MENQTQKTATQNRLAMKTLLVFLAAVLLLVGVGVLASACSNVVNDGSDSNYQSSNEATNFVRLTVTYTDANDKKHRGEIIVELYDTVAPETVANFKKLVGEGFYDGLTFHRVYKGFMIQGGDPKGDGTGGSSQNIKGEFSSNGFQNDLSHTRGVISMARSDKPDSASSQFFIVHEDSTFLDGDYAGFGKVVSGMATVDGIANIRVARSNPFSSERTTPVNPVTIEKAEFVSYVGQ